MHHIAFYVIRTVTGPHGAAQEGTGEVYLEGSGIGRIAYGIKQLLNIRSFLYILIYNTKSHIQSESSRSLFRKFP